MVDRAVVDAIVAAVDPRPGEALVEIGPGLGAISLPLAALSAELTVIEIDRALAAHLCKNPALRVVEGDALSVDFAALSAARGSKLRVIGNLPYNISTPILFHLSAYIDQILDQHVMLQKEVVARMTAHPGRKDYGRLSVMLQWRYSMQTILDVPPSAFEPSPRVDSAVVRMKPRAPMADIDAQLLGELVSKAFSQRRKLLRNTLEPWLAARQFSGEFDLQRRAEEVPVEEYLSVVRLLGTARNSA